MLKTVVNIPLVVMQIFIKHFMYKKGNKQSSKITKNETKIMFSIQNTPLLNIRETFILVSASGMKLAGIRSTARMLKGGA